MEDCPLDFEDWGRGGCQSASRYRVRRLSQLDQTRRGRDLSHRVSLIPQRQQLHNVPVVGKQASLAWASGSLILRHAEDPTSLQLEIFLHSFTTYSTRLGMFCDQEEEEEEEEATAVAAAAAC